MSLITIKGHNGKTVDVDPERIEGLEYDDDARLTRVFLFGGNWLSVVMPRQDVRKILDEAMATRRLVEETATVVKHDHCRINPPVDPGSRPASVVKP